MSDYKHRYLPVTEEDRKEMLETIGVKSVDELFEDIPASVRDSVKEAFKQLPEALTESELKKYAAEIAAKNVNADDYAYFLGAGTYDHFIPAVVNSITQRQEFLTAYTPYQPEASQGELQALFEYQTMLAELTGMYVTNDSTYDGFVSLGEACNLATKQAKRDKVLLSMGVHPQGREVLHTYGYGMDYEVEDIPLKGDVTDFDKLKEAFSADEVGAVVVQYPNFLGSIEDLKAIKELMEGSKALLVVSANPLALGVLESPGALGADIVVGDTQPFGIPMSFGGPHAGYIATTKKYMRKLPSRIIGQTVDANGQRGYAMTMQTREQHIRREKATSNMSSNQGLMALTSAIFMSAVGKEGIIEMAKRNINKAHYLAQSLKAKGFDVLNESAFFNEFIVDLKQPVAEVNKALLDKGFVGGYDVSEVYGQDNTVLLCATEKRTKEEIDAFVEALVEVTK
ncbi:MULTISPECIES: aminomethyl-transferring glycine dehydrogenase subunit GcvPA [Aerococcus]|uniref:Probable glycine dehydrogenase (decarboxylating) subunit 1 n=1 Tax=Aerococcus sanguinicola TaxID=119206 RepID=A0A5N1GPL7_9LACT|nr:MULTISPECIES: aminomethyl-transferring glycine dehydrogenase subunit GcvPA [Aerococcus]KAA9302334.1 aminomethyl-transferring glycine dehydrogenase subunit GcvPA [Aerococcus sanguinicola]MDK6370014.1 aminomethyl-transferring glycine dehydrogenase subunit GcvPA [Aerococcus sp. UMB9870]MDK6678991.1 aminomethyl-transferring glycine dehydrogenase subunit GcvPA [Aerococcus sp. UMB8608]MDK6687528.1 aminomethyl-transferring glycine dehydrogenase subunit GcvPA [Aerococcus sp. UMB8623]MDK6939650.1 am